MIYNHKKSDLVQTCLSRNFTRTKKVLTSAKKNFDPLQKIFDPSQNY